MRPITSTVFDANNDFWISADQLTNDFVRQGNANDLRYVIKIKAPVVSIDAVDDLRVTVDNTLIADTFEKEGR
jgi:hypothetical protein